MGKKEINNKPLLAIDLGANEVRATVAVQAEDGTLQVLACECKNYRTNGCVLHGRVEKPSEVAYTLKQCVSLLENRIKQTLTSAFVAYGGYGVRTLHVSEQRRSEGVLTVSARQLDEMRKDCIQRLEASPEWQEHNLKVQACTVESYLLDGKVTDEPITQRTSCVEVQYIIVAAPEVYITNLKGCFDRAGLSIETFFLKSDALSAVLLDENERNNGCALLDLGEGTTTLSVYYNGFLHTLGTCPIGSYHVTHDVSTLGISMANAEKLKIKAGIAREKSVKRAVLVQVPAAEADQPIKRIETTLLARIIEARLKQALMPVFKQINMLPFELRAGIVLTGGGADQHGITDLINDYIQSPVRIGSFADWFADDTLPLSSSNNMSAGILILAAEYREKHPIIEDKPIVPRKGFFGSLGRFKDKTEGMITNLFTDTDQY